jgi:putative ABC transport system ATP-binding protein
MKTSNLNPSHPVVLECLNLSKVFHLRGREIPVLNGVQLSVQQGESVVISGRSGTGKSTLLQILAGLDRSTLLQILAGLDRPTQGTVTLNNQSLTTLSNQALSLIRQIRIGMIFQRFNLLPSWTALENVQAALFHSTLSLSERQHRARALLTDLGLAEHCDHLPFELSIGQQQRVAVARALVNSPALVFADEPSGEVDSETGTEIVNCLVRCVKKQNSTLIVATHGTFPIHIADRRFHLTAGQLTEHPA